MSFATLGLDPRILSAVTAQGYHTPTPIQQQTIPVILEGKDVLAGAQTGTGKTAAFGLPLLQLVNSESTTVQAVILVPTRELGQQIFRNLEDFSKYIENISIASICGGTPIKPQIERLKEGAQVVVATPGRLIDLIQDRMMKDKKLPTAEHYIVKGDAFLIKNDGGNAVTAYENAIAQEPRNIKAKVIAEGANGPCTPAAEEIFTAMGGMIIPDMYCNAGGVTVSYFEWLKNLSHVAFGRMDNRYAENSNANLINTLER